MHTQVSPVPDPQSPIGFVVESAGLLEAWRELLDEEGIPAQLPGLRDGQTLGGMFGSTGVGVEVRVRAADVARACELLASLTTGRAIVLRTFPISKVGTVAGCRVLSGLIERSCRVNVIREQKIINTYSIASLKREKEDVREVRDGLECGIRLDGFNDVKEGDLLECFKVEERKRSLDL